MDTVLTVLTPLNDDRYGQHREAFKHALGKAPTMTQDAIVGALQEPSAPDLEALHTWLLDTVSARP